MIEFRYFKNVMNNKNRKCDFLPKIKSKYDKLFVKMIKYTHRNMDASIRNRWKTCCLTMKVLLSLPLIVLQPSHAMLWRKTYLSSLIIVKY